MNDLLESGRQNDFGTNRKKNSVPYLQRKGTRLFFELQPDECKLQVHRELPARALHRASGTRGTSLDDYLTCCNRALTLVCTRHRFILGRYASFPEKTGMGAIVFPEKILYA